MGRTILSGIAICAALASCAPRPPTPALITAPAPRAYPHQPVPAAMRDAIEQAVRANLKDPSSAQFGDMDAYQAPAGGLFVCGLVNARNSYGGYAGAVPYFVGDGRPPLVDVADGEGEGRGMFADEHPECEAFAR